MTMGPSFAQQRLVCFGLLLGVSAYAIVVAVVLEQAGKGFGPQPNDVLDTVAVAVGCAAALAAFGLRTLLGRAAAVAAPSDRASARFRALLVPMAMLEGGCLLGITTWMWNGNPVPGLVVAMVLLALMIAIVPLRDPDEGAA